ncbi:hypothetical protein SLITK23_59230 [Streptomyces lividans]|nr:hypothetical protein SLITK23_59230 [Streptomyces lividans]
MRATIAVVEDCVMEDLDPKGVTDVAAKLRGQADRLDQVAADRADARADWAENAQVGRRDRSSSHRPGPSAPTVGPATTSCRRASDGS